MLKNTLAVAGLVAGLMATNAWAANAFSCVRIEGEYIVNICSEPIEAAWGDGDVSHGASWTIPPHAKIPHSLPKGSYIKYDACFGANSIKSFNNGYGGLECKK